MKFLNNTEIISGVDTWIFGEMDDSGLKKISRTNLKL